MRGRCGRRRGRDCCCPLAVLLFFAKFGARGREVDNPQYCIFFLRGWGSFRALILLNMIDGRRPGFLTALGRHLPPPDPCFFLFWSDLSGVGARRFLNFWNPLLHSQLHHPSSLKSKGSSNCVYSGFFFSSSCSPQKAHAGNSFFLSGTEILPKTFQEARCQHLGWICHPKHYRGGLGPGTSAGGEEWEDTGNIGSRRKLYGRGLRDVACDIIRTM